MQFRVLGTVEVHDDTGPLALGGPKQRAVLVHLLLRAGHVVPTDRLIDAVWQGEPPRAARVSLHSYVSKLRGQLAADHIVARDGGYLLAVADDEVDSQRFERLVGEARTVALDPPTRADLLGRALALWRGPALEDLADQPAVQPAARRLDELRVTAQELWIDARLAQDGDGEVIADLEALLAAEPLRERLWNQLMTALYRAGRQADALAAYQRVRTLLNTELAIEPSPDLQRVQAQVLSQDPALDIGGLPLRGYRVLDRIGTGSRSTVYRAVEPDTGRALAIRVLDPDDADDPDLVRRFDGWARAVAAAEHPHLVPLIDWWREPGAAYLVTAFVDGGTLAAPQTGRPLDDGARTRIFDQVAAALRAVHRRGLAHGGVHASNVLLDSSGTGHLSDVGLADLCGDGPRATIADDLAALDDLATALRRRITTSAWKPPSGEHRLPNPYKGLRAFDEPDAADFFGRSAAIERLVARVADDAARFLAVVGPSGSGKSSLVRAGLLSALRGGAVAGSEGWLIVRMVPGHDPFDELAAALRSIARDATDDLPTRVEESLGQVVADIVSPDGDLLLLVDQFEELFTLVDDDTLRRRFIAVLVDALTAVGSRLRVIVTLRADFLDRPLLHTRLAQLLEDRTEFVAPLTASEVEQAVTGPAARSGVAVEPALVDEIVHDVGGHAGALPLLQYALTELYERGDDPLSQASYGSVGGLTGALTRRANDVLEGRAHPTREAARQLFLRLVRLGRGVEDTARRVTQAEVVGLVDDRAAMADAIAAFGKARLLTFDRDPDTREPTVEIAHEALLTQWARLRDWIATARDEMLMERRLAAATQEWRSAGRDASFLATGHRLDGFAELVASDTVAVPADERAYVVAAVRQRRHLEASEAARVAERDRLRRRSAGRLRALLVVLSLAALLASGLSVFALRQRDAARNQARVSSARSLAAAAVANLDVDPQRSVLLSIEAVERTRTVDGTTLPAALDALHRAIGASRLVRTLPSTHAPLAWHPAGATFAVAAGTSVGAIELRTASTGQVRRSIDGHDGAVTGVAFDRGGTWMATTGADGALCLWSAETGRRLHCTDVGGEVTAPAFSPDGTVVAASIANVSTIVLVDTGSGAVTDEITTGGTAVSISLASDGALAYATSQPRAAIVVVDRVTGAQRFSLDVPEDLLGVAFSPDGRWLATAADGLVDAATGDRVDAGDAPVAQLGVTVPSWSADGTRMVTGGVDGSAHVWDVADEGALTEAEALVGPTAGAALDATAISADGTMVLTAAASSGVHMWDVGPTAGAEVARLPADTRGNPGIAWAPDSSRLAVGAGDGKVAVWDTSDWTMSATLPSGGIADNIAWSPDGSLLAIPSDGAARVRNAVDHTEVFAISYGGDFGTAAWTPDGRHLAVGGERGVTVVDRRGAVVSRLTNLRGFPEGLGFSNDGSLLGVAVGIGTGDTAVAVWDWRTGELRWRADTAVNNVAFDPTSGRLVTAPADGTPAVMAARDGGDLTLLVGHAGGVQHAAFSSDGQTVATGSFDATVRLWNATSGDELLVLRGHRGFVHRVAFSPDGRWLASSSPVDGVRVWALRVGDLLTVAQEKVTRRLTAQECARFLSWERCG